MKPANQYDKIRMVLSCINDGEKVVAIELVRRLRERGYRTTSAALAQWMRQIMVRKTIGREPVLALGGRNRAYVYAYYKL